MSYSDNPFIPQMLSPAAYETGRYGRTPASHFYGLPNISIPLTEVRAKGCSLPVSLSYNAGGHKPEQHPGWVGLGWSLNAGGCIIRVVNGLKDEMSRYEYSERYGGTMPEDDPGYLHHISEVQTVTNWDVATVLASKSLPWVEFEPDEYIINAPGIHASFFITGSGYGSRYTLSERGLKTGSLVKILDSYGAETFLWSVAYYDDRGRPVQTRESTHIGGVQKEYYGYDFTGNMIKKKTVMIPQSGSQETVVRTFSYDAMGRPAVTTHQIGTAAAKTIADRSYDKVGRLLTDLRNSQGVLKETRKYNIRSWLTEISGPRFLEYLRYEDGSVPQWGGNISAVGWGNSSTAVQKSYQYRYDALSRLVSASLSGGTSAAAYSESYAYDKNGNMVANIRGGQSKALTISGNRLVQVANSGLEYDGKGRLVYMDGSPDLMTDYNILDLPQRHMAGSTVMDYCHSSDGRKLQECVTEGSVTVQRDYVGDFIYEDGVLKRIMFDGGYVHINGSSKVYMFFLKDHLGSVRAVVSETGAVAQTNEYYPFGDLFATSSSDSTGNRFLFGGKELSAETGLYDFSARFLLSRFGRFTTIDPLAEKYPSVSPYAYCNSNPVRYVDPDGRREWPVNPTYNGYKRKNLNNYRNPRPNHNGIDINLGSGDNDLGAPVYATHEGIVTRKRSFTDDSDGGGNRIQITSIDGEISTYYMHLNTIEAYKEGDFIEEGALIGTIGGSGKRKINEYTPHLHYEIKISGEYVNPAIDEDNLVDPQSFIAPIYLGEINPAIVIDENNNKLQRSFNIVLSVINAIEIK